MVSQEGGRIGDLFVWCRWESMLMMKRRPTPVVDMMDPYEDKTKYGITRWYDADR